MITEKVVKGMTTPPMNTYETFFHLAVSSAVPKGSGGAGWGAGCVGKGGAGWHARIASSIECPDICRTPVGARIESRRNAIIGSSSCSQGQQVVYDVKK